MIPIDSPEAAEGSGQPYMTDEDGQVFYPDNPEDADQFAELHGAWWVGVPKWMP
jgi:hypothetical protein